MPFIVHAAHTVSCMINHIYIYGTYGKLAYIYALYGAHGKWGQVYKIMHKIRSSGEGAHSGASSHPHRRVISINAVTWGLVYRCSEPWTAGTCCAHGEHGKKAPVAPALRPGPSLRYQRSPKHPIRNIGICGNAPPSTEGQRYKVDTVFYFVI